MVRPGGPTAGDDFSRYLGLRWGEPGVLRLDVREGMVNNVGRLLGPISFALVDYGMSAVVWDSLADDETTATINVAINFVDSTRAGEVVCRSRIDRRTRRVAATSSDVRAADGRLLATAVGSFAVLSSNPR
jgi:uncharacterized protein (TIGR00369 family)